VDCKFSKNGLPSVSVRKINAVCPVRTIAGKQSCPADAELAECINGKDVQQFANGVEAYAVDVPAPAGVAPTELKGNLPQTEKAN
jgi:hypothetical protein